MSPSVSEIKKEIFMRVLYSQLQTVLTWFIRLERKASLTLNLLAPTTVGAHSNP
jgi:hypothetical protein